MNFSDKQFQPETIAAWLAFYVEAQKSTALRRLLRIYARRLHSNLMSGLAGLMPRPIADQTAEGIAALIDGLYIRRALKDGTPNAASAVALVEDYLETRLSGFRGSKHAFSEANSMSVVVPTLDHLKRAYAVTSQATQVTPLLESAALARETGAARVFVKPESLQWAGSFKVRGAYWRLKQLSPEEAKRGVVAYSSGNFAQGLAAAGQALGIPVTIVMPIDAPAAKREATGGYGATVVLTDHGERAREEVASPSARDRSPRKTGSFCCIRSTIPRSSPARRGAGLEALDQLAARRARRPTSCSARSAAAG